MIIDLNCDMGEGFGPYRLGDDQAMLASVTSANLACGFHAGDPLVMDQTIALCAAAGVAVGAHPGYADRRGFGRRPVAAPPAEVRADLIYQIGALAALAKARGLGLTHVKAHGALYNRAAVDEALAGALIEAVAACGPGLVLVCLAGPAGQMIRRLARQAGLKVAAEFFADRGYLSDGRLAPRDAPGALIDRPELAVERCLELLTNGRVRCLDGAWLALEAQTICLHGDGPAALATAKLLGPALRQAGVALRPLAELAR